VVCFHVTRRSANGEAVNACFLPLTNDACHNVRPKHVSQYRPGLINMRPSREVFSALSDPNSFNNTVCL
jgi:hypothetical protein